MENLNAAGHVEMVGMNSEVTNGTGKRRRLVQRGTSNTAPGKLSSYRILTRLRHSSALTEKYFPGG